MLRNNTVMKILSLIIAISLWGYVVWDTNPTIKQTFNDVPVQVRNLSSLEERGLVLLNEEDYTVNVKVQGKKKDIANLTVNDISVTADIGGFGEGDTTVTVNVHTLDNASVIEVTPNKITFSIDRIVEAEKVVRVGVTEELPENREYAVNELPFTTATVRGASSLVDSVTHVAADIDVSKLTEEESLQTVRLVAQNSHGEEVEGVTVNPGSVELTTRLYHTKTVPLTVEVTGEPGEGYDVTHVTVPDSVVIKGNQGTLNNIQLISGYIDVSGMTGSGRVQAVLNLPQGITLSKSNTVVNVSVTIKGTEPDQPDVQEPDNSTGSDQNNQDADSE